MKLSDIIPAPPELGLVENIISSKFTSDAPQIEEISSYLHQLGGKRIRPLLTLVCGRSLGMTKVPKELLDIAAGIELIHLATLLHDDIIDKSIVRRHKESAFAKFGMTDTLLTGDFLLVRAFSLCAHLDTEIIHETEKACVELTEGEILEIPLFKQTHTLESSLTIARKKTAALFRLASFSAAHIMNADKDAKKAFADFGENLGIAFQILDDILDVLSSQELLGKTIGGDIKERKPSIVNVLWLEKGSELSKQLRSEHEDDSFIENALVEIKASGVIAEAKKLASHYADKSKNSLREGLKLYGEQENIYAKQLLTLIDFTLQRMN